MADAQRARDPRRRGPDLTAAAWNRRRAHPQRPHLRHWLRAMPEGERTDALIHIFGALFFALPGSALVIFCSSRHPSAFSATVLAFVGLLFAAHALSALHPRHAGASPRRYHAQVRCVLFLLAGTVAVWLHLHAPGTSAWLLAGGLTYAAALMVALLSQRPAMCTLRHGLWVLGSVLLFIAVASITVASPG